MTCPNCKRKVDKLVAGVVNGEYISERCESCMANASASALYANKWRRDRDREDYRRDILQVGDPEFIKEYPDVARQKGYSEQQLRKYS